MEISCEGSVFCLGYHILWSYASTCQGADLANLLNEGAIMAARKAKTEMDADDAW